MTPGYARTRSHLPHLYYPRHDTVRVINAQQGGPWTPAVNGKTPISAWVPTRDDDGSGTSTLADLVGSNNLALTNMTPATDWVADTDAGGVRALDFDGVDDYATGSSLSLSDFSVSAWVNCTGANAIGEVLSNRALGAAGASIPGFTLGSTGTSNSWGFFVEGESGNYRWVRLNRTSLFSNNAWTHVVATRNAGTLAMWINAVDKTAVMTTTSVGTLPATIVSGSDLIMSGRPGTADRSFSGRIDDVRVFGSVLDASDIADLYASGDGRGVRAR